MFILEASPGNVTRLECEAVLDLVFKGNAGKIRDQYPKLGHDTDCREWLMPIARWMLLMNLATHGG